MSTFSKFGSVTALAILGFALPVSVASNTVSHYFCDDLWIDPSGTNAKSWLFPVVTPPTDQSIRIVNAEQTETYVTVPVVYNTTRAPNNEFPLTLQGAKVDGATMSATLTYPLRFLTNPMMTGTFRDNLKFPKLSPGDYRLGLQLPYGCVQGIAGSGLDASVPQWILRVAGLRPTVIVSTLAYLPMSRNFMTASLDVVQVLRATPGVGPSFALLDDNFRAWPAVGDAPPAAVPVCRLFRASTITHAYSADAAECASLRANPAWTDEGIEFRALVPTNGVCASGTEPIYKLTNASLGDTQRFTRSEMTNRTLQLNGWTARGVAFCSPVG